MPETSRRRLNDAEIFNCIQLAYADGAGDYYDALQELVQLRDREREAAEIIEEYRRRFPVMKPQDTLHVRASRYLRGETPIR